MAVYKITIGSSLPRGFKNVSFAKGNSDPFKPLGSSKNLPHLADQISAGGGHNPKDKIGLLDKLKNSYSKVKDSIVSQIAEQKYNLLIPEFRAVNLFHAGKREKAMQILEQVLKKEPTNVLALNRLAEFYFKEGNLEKAGQLNSRALIIAPEDLEAEFNASVLSYFRGDISSSAAYFCRIFQKKPYVIAALLFYAKALVRGNQGDTALKALGRVKDIPSEAIIYLKSYSLREVGKVEKALEKGEDVTLIDSSERKLRAFTKEEVERTIAEHPHLGIKGLGVGELDQVIGELRLFGDAKESEVNFLNFILKKDYQKVCSWDMLWHVYKKLGFPILVMLVESERVGK